MDSLFATISPTAIAAVSTLIVGLILYIKLVKTGHVYKHTTRLDGKTVLITGGNAGIGKETAVLLAKIGARVIIACRNEKKAADAMLEIRSRSGSESVHYMIVDLADRNSIRKFASEFADTEPRLNILINNAGVLSSGCTKSGLDLMFATNVCGPFLLTHLLMPVLKNTAKVSPVRIVNVSSEGYRFGEVDLENLSPNLELDAPFAQVFVQYFNTKLMLVYLTSELEKRLRVDPGHPAISAFSVHPGTIKTDLSLDYARDCGGWKYFFRSFLWPFVTKSPFYGCQTILYCCLEEGIEDMGGKYFSDLKMQKLLPHACDEKIGAKLWEKCEEICGLEKE